MLNDFLRTHSRVVHFLLIKNCRKIRQCVKARERTKTLIKQLPLAFLLRRRVLKKRAAAKAAKILSEAQEVFYVQIAMNIK